MKRFLVTLSIILALVLIGGVFTVTALTTDDAAQGDLYAAYDGYNSWWDDLDSIDTDDYGKDYGKDDGDDDDYLFPYAYGPRWYAPLGNSAGWHGEGFDTSWDIPLEWGTTIEHNFSEDGLRLWVHPKSFNYYPTIMLRPEETVFVDWNEPVNFHIDTTQASDFITAWPEAIFVLPGQQGSYGGFAKIKFDQVMTYVTDNDLDPRLNPTRPRQGYYQGSITLRDALTFIINNPLTREDHRADAQATYNAFLATGGTLRLWQVRVLVFAPDMANDPDFDNAAHFEVWPTYFHEDNFALIHEFSFGRSSANALPLDTDDCCWGWPADYFCPWAR